VEADAEAVVEAGAEAVVEPAVEVVVEAGADGWLRRCRKAGWEYLNPGVWAPWNGTDTRRMEGDR
jgi:hypothetical protein